MHFKTFELTKYSSDMIGHHEAKRKKETIYEEHNPAHDSSKMPQHTTRYDRAPESKKKKKYTGTIASCR